jgi:hypothetical protein
MTPAFPVSPKTPYTNTRHEAFVGSTAPVSTPACDVTDVADVTDATDVTRASDTCHVTVSDSKSLVGGIEQNAKESSPARHVTRDYVQACDGFSL